MHKNIINILCLWIPLLLWGCAGSHDGPDSTPGEDLSIRIDISLLDIPQTNRNSRADAVSDITDFEPATLPTELINTLRVIIVDKENKIEHNRFLSHVNPVEKDEMIFKVSSREPREVYIFANELDESWEGKGYFDFESLKTGSVFPADAIKALVVQAGDGNVLFDNRNESGKVNIPINEFFTLDLGGDDADPPAGALKPVNSDSGSTLGTDLNPYTFKCFITRASSKFSFRISYDRPEDLPGNASVSVKEIRVRSIGDREYLLPNQTVYLPAKNLSSSNPYEGRFITAYTLPQGSAGDVVTFRPGNVTFSSTNKEAKTYSPEIYFPETASPANGGKYQVQIVTFTSTDGVDDVMTEWVDLPNLDSLPRNTHVVVNITLKGVEIDCMVDVVPYIGIVLKPGFGFDEFLPGDHDKPTDW